MIRTPILPLLAFTLALVATACGGPEAAPSADPAADDGGHSHAQGAHGGAVAVLGDHAAHLEAVHDTASGTVTIWLSDADMKPMAADGAPVLNLVGADGSSRVTGSAHDGGWRFEDAALKGHPEKARFRLALGGVTYTPDLPCDHGHAAHGPHDGTLAAFNGPDGQTAGEIELKLHDDKGDLELWLNADATGLDPFDLAVGAEIQVVFEQPQARTVTLKVRNTVTNEDEDGVANLRDGKTNYFIFPGDTGADATWLMGADFVGRVVVRFERDGTAYATEGFELKPHTHAAGGH